MAEDHTEGGKERKGADTGGAHERGRKDEEESEDAFSSLLSPRIEVLKEESKPEIQPSWSISPSFRRTVLRVWRKRSSSWSGAEEAAAV